MAEIAVPDAQSAYGQLVRYIGGIALAASLLLVAQRLWQLDWSTLRPQLSFGLVAAIVGGALLVAAADLALARAWSSTADPDDTVLRDEMRRIYARGVLMKYLPGSVFQYVSRQLGGAKSGLEHKRLAQSALIEICLHIVGSLSIVAICFLSGFSILTAGIAGVGTAIVLGSIRHPITTALLFQMIAFGCFALAAALIGTAALTEGAGLARFAAFFLLAWLAGFVVPVAPGGLGVREAALLFLAAGAWPSAGLMVATLAMRLASILGDVLFGLTIAIAVKSRPKRA